jgi:hypothetical protein
MPKFDIEINQSDVDRTFKWIETRGNNTTKLWKAVTPIMRKQVEREFSDENPNRWKALSPRYLQEKLEAGYPATVGVRTGLLKRCATDKANIVYRKDYMLYSIGSQQERFSDFNAKRKIFKHSQRYMQAMYKQVAQKWINEEVAS